MHPKQLNIETLNDASKRSDAKKNNVKKDRVASEVAEETMGWAGTV